MVISLGAWHIHSSTSHLPKFQLFQLSRSDPGEHGDLWPAGKMEISGVAVGRIYLDSTILYYYTIPEYTILYLTILDLTRLYYSVLAYCTVPYLSIRDYTILSYTIQLYTTILYEYCTIHNSTIGLSGLTTPQIRWLCPGIKLTACQWSSPSAH